MDYDKLHYKTELMEVAKIDGKYAYRVEITSPKNVVSSDYFSADTWLKGSD